MTSVYEKTQDEGLVQVQTLKRADHVGVIALYSGKPHKGTVISSDTVKCGKMSVKTFRREIEPIINFLKAKSFQYHSITGLLV
jgi:hypothetical protein